MTLKQIYNLAIQVGIKTDPRGKKEVDKILKKEKEKFKELKKQEQEEFDQEKFFNPYADSRILNDISGDKQIKRILVGIDLEGPEILLADRLTEKGKKIDLLIAHHPEGKALASLSEVMHLQEDLLYKLGVSINVAEGIMNPHIAEVARTIAPANHFRAIDMAKILNFSFMCVHTPADNLVMDFIQKKIDREKPETLGEIIKLLKTIPEYNQATKENAGPKIFVGHSERKAGKIAISEITGGTEGPKEIYEKLSHAGVGTVIGMHMSEASRKEAEKYHINVVIAGHYSSDSLGMNLFLDELEKRGIEIIPCSGLIRVKRFLHNA
ncbi:NGG1p interacting factor NIF3 [Candidatus Kuenenbacteria bacterium]|nr:NGG1p interacting factor NIF3 [Candidatus Kuenenbacteria bacterium]